MTRLNAAPLSRIGLGIASAALALAVSTAAAQPQERGGPGAGKHYGPMMQPNPGMMLHQGQGTGYGPAWEWMRGGYHGGFGDPMSPLWALELEGEKLTMLRDLRRAHRELQAGHAVKLAEMRDEMAELLAVEKPDAEAVEELYLRMAELRGELLAERVRMRNEMIELLDEEQRERFREEFGPRRR